MSTPPTKPPSLYRQVIYSVATRLAHDPALPAENAAALRDHLAALIDQTLCSLVPGERLLVPKRGFEAERRASRITAAIRAGRSSTEIAAAECVSMRWVQRVRRRGTIKP